MNSLKNKLVDKIVNDNKFHSTCISYLPYEVRIPIMEKLTSKLEKDALHIYIPMHTYLAISRRFNK